MLYYKLLEAKKKVGSLFFLHGIMGNHRNLQSISRGKFIRENFDIYNIDLRNHGESFHDPDSGIRANSNDILNLVQKNQVKNLTIIGHSFGGRIAIDFATQFSNEVKSLILLDISNQKMKNPESSLVYKYLNQLLKIDLNQEKKQIVQDIRNIESEKVIQDFLLTNLQQSKTNKQKYEWRNNLQALKNSFLNNMSFEYTKTFDGKVTIIAGRKSNYVLKDNLYQIQKVFPKFKESDLIFLNSGHWIHAEQPQEVNDLIEQHLMETYNIKNIQKNNQYSKNIIIIVLNGQLKRQKMVKVDLKENKNYFYNWVIFKHKKIKVLVKNNYQQIINKTKQNKKKNWQILLIVKKKEIRVKQN